MKFFQLKKHLRYMLFCSIFVFLWVVFIFLKMNSQTGVFYCDERGPISWVMGSEDEIGRIFHTNLTETPIQKVVNIKQIFVNGDHTIRVCTGDLIFQDRPPLSIGYFMTQPHGQLNVKILTEAEVKGKYAKSVVLTSHQK